MMSDERKKYDKEFKQKSVELAYARGIVTEIIKIFVIRPQMLFRWRRELKRSDKNSFPGNGRPVMTDQELEIARLERELRYARMERGILKKATSIFSRSEGKSTNS